MGISYKAFYFKRTVFCLLISFILILSVAKATASPDLLTIENVTVDITAENSVAARDQAFAKAQMDAYTMLAERLKQQGYIHSYKKPDSVSVSAMIQDYEVTQEKISGVRYVGTYIFRFRKVAVERFFGIGNLSTELLSQTPTTEGQPQEATTLASDQQTETILVLPFYKAQGRLTIWSENNIWMQAWVRKDTQQGDTNIEIPIGDLMDVADLGETQALNYETNRLSRMLSRYNAREAAVVIAAPDQFLSAVSSDGLKAVGSIRISLYRTDRRGPELVKELDIRPGVTETRSQLYDRAVGIVFQALQKEDWKAKTISETADALAYKLHVTITSINQWVRIQQSLRNIQGLSNFSVLSLKPREAFIQFRFRGDATALAQSLAQANMTLSAPTNPQRGSVYELSMGAPVGGNNFYREPDAGSDASSDVHTF